MMLMSWYAFFFWFVCMLLFVLPVVFAVAVGFRSSFLAGFLGILFSVFAEFRWLLFADFLELPLFDVCSASPRFSKPRHPSIRVYTRTGLELTLLQHSVDDLRKSRLDRIPRTHCCSVETSQNQSCRGHLDSLGSQRPFLAVPMQDVTQELVDNAQLSEAKRNLCPKHCCKDERKLTSFSSRVN